MSRSTFSGPVLSGTNKYNQFANVGNAVLIQTDTLVANSTNVVNATSYIPAGSQVIGFTVDVTTAWDSVTSATLSVGTSSGDTTYVSGVSTKTAGRIAVTFTAAQLTAMLATATDTTVTNTLAAQGISAPTSTLVFTVTPVGATTVGSVTITTQYAQSNDRPIPGSSQSPTM